MAKTMLIPSREQTRAGWRAYGAGDVTRREADAIVGDLLHVGSRHIAAAINFAIAVAEVVYQN